MGRETVVKGLIDYLKGEHWRRTIAMLAQDPDPHYTHAHVYVETCVHPQDLERLICGYLERRGMPSSRRIDYVNPSLVPDSETGSLHGIEPKGKPHFDLQWFYNPSVVLAGTQELHKMERGCNVIGWNRWFIQEFYSDFSFRSVGPAEQEALEKYFRSEHWLIGMEMATRPETRHLHVHVYTSLHPEVIQGFAEKSLAEHGHKIYYTCPNVYGKRELTGKLVFMGQEPEVVFDLAWKFRPEVVIEAARDPWGPGAWPARDLPGYTHITAQMIEPTMQKPYVVLGDAEVDEVLDSVAPRKRM